VFATHSLARAVASPQHSFENDVAPVAPGPRQRGISTSLSFHISGYPQANGSLILTLAAFAGRRVLQLTGFSRVTMRLVWLSVIGILCIASAFLLRGSMSAHAERNAGPIEWTRSNVDSKGNRLDLKGASSLEPRLASILDPLARPAVTMRSKADTVSWHWRQGAKTITKVLSNGKTTHIPRTTLARRD
jgi:hypothetical protein